MTLPALEVYIRILTFVNLGFVLAALFYLWKNRKSFFVYGSELKKAEEKSAEIIQDAIEKANALVSAAELKGVEAVSSYKKSAKEAQELYEQKLTEFLENICTQFASTVKGIEAELEASQDKYEAELDTLSASLAGVKNAQTESFTKELHEVLEQFHSKLLTIPQQVSRSLEEYAETEKAQLEDALQDYERNRKRFVDEHTALMLEDLLRLTLEKAITLEQHVDIVEQALEKAREEGFFDNA